FANGLYGALAYGYDAVGNRTSQSGGTTNLAESYTYAAESNQLLSIANGTTTRSLAYSATGALASDSRSGTGLSFEYGEDDRPDQVANPVQVLAMYDHDFLGRRVMKDVTGTTKKAHKINKHPKKKTPPSIVTHFLYDRAGHLLAEPDAGTGATGNEYIWLDDLLVGLVSSGTLYFVHPDHLGTPQKVTDATQALAFDLVLRPFGQAEQQTFPSLTNLRFPGQYFDAEDSLHQNGFRDYDPSLGRYIESDPIGLGGGINTYAYVAGNPVMSSDPFGLQPTPPPSNIPGGPWKWSPDPGNSRDGAFKGPNNTSASWDPVDDHWDVDDGHGNRQRYNRWGAPIDKQEAHSPYNGPKRLPLLPRLLRACPPIFLLERQMCFLDPSLCSGSMRP